MKTQLSLFILCCIVIIASQTSAQSFTSKGTVELGGEFSFSSQTVSSSLSSSSNRSALNTLMFNPYIGTMVAEGFELGFMPGIATVSYGGSSSTQTNLFFVPSYNVNTSGKAFPYFEFLIGYNSISGSGNGSESGLGVGFSGGVKVAIGNSGLFLFNVKYLHQSYNVTETNYYYNFGSPTNTSYTESLNTVLASIGFHIFIPSKSSRSK